jgi:hypothetical protein
VCCMPVCAPVCTCRKVENKLLEMLNMRGRHKHKWDSLRQVLADKVVYDDNNMRVWMNPDGSGQGLLYYAKQAQVGGWWTCGGWGCGGWRVCSRTQIYILRVCVWGGGGCGVLLWWCVCVCVGGGGPKCGPVGGGGA